MNGPAAGDAGREDAGRDEQAVARRDESAAEAAARAATAERPEVDAKAQAENFPVALKLLPKAVRADLMAFYVFARYVDDLGDEFDGDRVAALTAVDADLARLAGGATPRLEPVHGLQVLTAGGRVPVEPFQNLVA
jgi:regulator of protease activity HflC (stomatin/prohibitin superfamily)